MYYRLDWRINETKLGLDLAVIDHNPCPEVSWFSGKIIKKKLPDPIVCELDDEDSGPDMPDMFDVDLTLFSDSMISALYKAGVDNMQLFNAEIINHLDGRKYSNYKAVNIVGLVECVDLNKSEYDSESEMHLLEFEHVFLDRSRIKDHLMFRLAENIGYIIVADNVRKQLDKAKLVGFTLEQIEVV